MAAIGRDPGEFGTILLYDDLHVIIESVREGAGIAFISRSLVEQDIRQGMLRAHRIEGFRHARSRTLAYRGDIMHNKATRQFIDCLTEPFGVVVPLD